MLFAAEATQLRAAQRELESAKAKVDECKRMEAVSLRAVEDAKRQSQDAVAAVARLEAELVDARKAATVAQHGKEEAERALIAEKKTVSDGWMSGRCGGFRDSCV